MKEEPLVSVLSSLQSGSRPKGGVTAESGEVPSIGAEHLLADGGFDFTNIKRIPSSFFQNMRAGRIKRSDILVVKDGATTGKTSFVRDDFPFDEAAVNEHVFCVRVDQTKASPPYVFHFLRSARGQRAILLDFRGATIGGISRGFATRVRLPLPPLPEQRRIAEVLDRAEALRAKRRAALNQLQVIKQSLFIEMFGDPATNPHDWPAIQLGDVVLSASDGPHVSPDYVESGIPFLSTRHVRPGGMSWRDLKFISHDEAQIHWRKCKPERGDILYTKGGTTGIAKVVDWDEPVAIWVHIALLKTDRSKVEPLWLEAMLNAPFCYRQSQRLTRGIANRDLGLTRMVTIGMYLPPIQLQREFARWVTAVEKLRAAQNASLAELDGLFASLQHHAFAGEL